MADPGLWAKLLHPEDRERALAQETRETSASATRRRSNTG